MHLCCSLLLTGSLGMVVQSHLTTNVDGIMEKLVNKVNTHPDKDWTAGKSFEDAGIKSIIDSMVIDTKEFKKMKIDSTGKAPHITEEQFQQLPLTFDSRQHWKRCLKNPIPAQGTCGAAWAFSAVGSLADRFCVKGWDLGQLSTQFVLNCDSTGHGCHGGHLAQTWDFLTAVGTPTDKCQPFTSPASEVRECKLVCDDESIEPFRYYANHTYEVLDKDHDVSSSNFKSKSNNHSWAVNRMMAELVFHGPFQITFDFHEDLLHYISGIYTHLEGSKYLGKFSGKLIGYGERDWVVAVSLGKRWGEFGTVRIKKGINECNIESTGHAFAAMPLTPDSV